MSTDNAVLANLVRHMAKKDTDPLTPLIDSYLIKRRRSKTRLKSYKVPIPEKPRPPGRLSPSTICGCERQAAFKFLGVKARKRIDPELELRFDDGNWRHHRWEATFKDMEAVLGKKKFEVLSIEARVMVPELYVAGALDAKVLIHRKPWVIDIKGINRRGFEYVYQRQAPIEDHPKQLCCYCVAEDVPRGMLLYDNKDDNRTMVFAIEHNPVIWNEVQEWCQRVVRKLERKKLPPKHPACDRGTFHFDRCPFAWVCFGDKDPEAIRSLVYRHFEGIDVMWERSIGD